MPKGRVSFKLKSSHLKSQFKSFDEMIQMLNDAYANLPWPDGSIVTQVILGHSAYRSTYWDEYVIKLEVNGHRPQTEKEKLRAKKASKAKRKNVSKMTEAKKAEEIATLKRLYAKYGNIPLQ